MWTLNLCSALPTKSDDLVILHDKIRQNVVLWCVLDKHVCIIPMRYLRSANTNNMIVDRWLSLAYACVCVCNSSVVLVWVRFSDYATNL